jgi:hypothetical protein
MVCGLPPLENGPFIGREPRSVCCNWTQTPQARKRYQINRTRLVLGDSQAGVKLFQLHYDALSVFARGARLIDAHFIFDLR